MAQDLYAFIMIFLLSDTNECANNDGGCDSDNGNCVNTGGSYYCTCNSGYQLGTDKHSCEGEYLH